MGNAESGAATTEKDLNDQYALLTAEQNYRFGDVSVFKDKSSGEVVWIKEIPLEDKASEVNLENYISSGAWKDPIFITSNVYRIFPKDSFFCSANCGGLRRITTVMRHFERDLESEIVQRSSEFEKDFFPEPEIWYIIESIMSVEAKTLKHNRFHGDLKTSTIFITDEGQTKFTDPMLLDPHESTYIKNFLGEKRSNLPPEYLQAWKSGLREVKTNPELADVFSLGIIILALSTLHADSEFYDYQQKDLNMSKIRDAVAEVDSRYSALLSQLAKGCLKERMAERLRISDVLRFVEMRKNSYN